MLQLFYNKPAPETNSGFQQISTRNDNIKAAIPTTSSTATHYWDVAASGVAQWLGRRSLAGRLSLIFT